MWFSQFPHDGQLSIRHTCEQGDRLSKYGWLKHDGVNFGTQEIVDDDFILMTDFVKQAGGDHGGDWTVRFSGRKREQVLCWVSQSLYQYFISCQLSFIFPFFLSHSSLHI